MENIMNTDYKALYEDAISQYRGLNAENTKLRQTVETLKDELKESKYKLYCYDRTKYIDFGKLTDCITELCELTYVTL